MAQNLADSLGAARRLETGTRSQWGRQVFVRRKMTNPSGHFSDGKPGGPIIVGRAVGIVARPADSTGMAFPLSPAVIWAS